MLTTHELVASARRRLAEAGIPQSEAELDARVLLERLLHWDAARYFAHGDEPVAPDLVERYAAVVDRRVAREPVAYIAGEQEFWGLPFVVTPAVLIPRPETELIVEIALAQTPDHQRAWRIADVCTGSGCLAVALARERPRATVAATDISATALAVAARNVGRHGVGDRVALTPADLFGDMTGPFDIVVSNPPYVPDGEREVLQPEVVEHEPHIALFAGADGLREIRRLAAAAASRLTPGGLLIFEFGYGQADAVADLLGEIRGLELVQLHEDLRRIPRTAVVRATR